MISVLKMGYIYCTRKDKKSKRNRAKCCTLLWWTCFLPLQIHSKFLFTLSVFPYYVNNRVHMIEQQSNEYREKTMQYAHLKSEIFSWLLLLSWQLLSFDVVMCCYFCFNVILFRMSFNLASTFKLLLSFNVTLTTSLLLFCNMYLFRVQTFFIYYNFIE